MKQTFNFNVNQILATYMYAKVKCLDLLSVATTREEIRFVADEFAKHLQNQEIQPIFFNDSYELDSNYYYETQNHYIIPTNINNINYFVSCVLAILDTKSSEVLWDNVNNGFFSSAFIKWKKKQVENDIEIVNDLERKYNQVFGDNTPIQKKLNNN